MYLIISNGYFQNYLEIFKLRYYENHRFAKETGGTVKNGRNDKKNSQPEHVIFLNCF